MLFPLHRSLASEIIQCLAKSPSANATELQEQIEYSYKHCSVQAIYKELRLLREAGFVVKYGKDYCLHLNWILRLKESAETIYQKHLQSDSPGVLLPVPDSKRRYEFTSLHAADDFLVHIFLSALFASNTKEAFGYFSHLWFEVVKEELEVDFRSNLADSQKLIHCIVGGDTELDRKLMQRWPRRVLPTYNQQSPFHVVRNQFIFCLAPFIIRLQYSTAVAKTIDNFFDSATKVSPKARRAMLSILNKKTRVTVTCENSELQSEVLEEKFLRYFRKHHIF